MLQTFLLVVASIVHSIFTGDLKEFLLNFLIKFFFGSNGLSSKIFGLIATSLIFLVL